MAKNTEVLITVKIETDKAIQEAEKFAKKAIKSFDSVIEKAEELSKRVGDISFDVDMSGFKNFEKESESVSDKAKGFFKKIKDTINQIKGIEIGPFDISAFIDLQEVANSTVQHILDEFLGLKKIAKAANAKRETVVPESKISDAIARVIDLIEYYEQLKVIISTFRGLFNKMDEENTVDYEEYVEEMRKAAEAAQKKVEPVLLASGLEEEEKPEEPEAEGAGEVEFAENIVEAAAEATKALNEINETKIKIKPPKMKKFVRVITRAAKKVLKSLEKVNDQDIEIETPDMGDFTQEIDSSVDEAKDSLKSLERIRIELPAIEMGGLDDILDMADDITGEMRGVLRRLGQVRVNLEPPDVGAFIDEVKKAVDDAIDYLKELENYTVELDLPSRGQIDELIDALNDTDDATEEATGGIRGTIASVTEAGQQFLEFSDTVTGVIDNVNEISGLFRRFRGDTEEATGSVSELSEESEQLQEEQEGVSDSFSVSTLAIGAFAAAAAAALAGIAALGGMAIAAASEVGDAMGKLQAQTGASAEEMEELKKSTMRVSKLTFAEDVHDAAEAVGEAARVTGQYGKALDETAAQALIFREAFDVEIKESIRAVGSAMKAFGVTAGDTFDLMTATLQEVGDPMEDLADTVLEYSPLFAQAGFSAEEMFSILQSGLKAGAMNFDFVGDLVKEFGIRIVDGSDTTRIALDELISTTTGVKSEFQQVTEQIDSTKAAMKGNQYAIDQAKAAYDAAEDKVKEMDASMRNAEGAFQEAEGRLKDLETALTNAKRELEALARPKLEGMDEFDDKLFELDQKAKKARLAMIDMEKDSPEFEKAQAELEKINKEMDRVSLERDIAMEPKMRELEKAVKDGTETTKTFDQAMADVANKKAEIAGLEGAIGGAKSEVAYAEQSFKAWEGAVAQANIEMNNAAALVESLEKRQESLGKTVEHLEEKLETAGTSSDGMLQSIKDGGMTSADAMFEVIEMLKKVEDPIKRNEMAVALFGTKWEDLGEDVVFALERAGVSIDDVRGKTYEAGNSMAGGLGNAIKRMKKAFFAGLVPIGEAILGTFEPFIPILDEFVARLGEKLPLVFDYVSGKIESGLGKSIEFVTGLVKDYGIPAFEFLSKILVKGVGWGIKFVSLYFNSVLVPAFDAVVKFVKGPLLENLKLLWNQLANTETVAMITNGINYIVENFSTISDWIVKDGTPLVSSFFGTLMEWVTVAMSYIVPIISTAIAVVDEIISTGLTLILDFWKRHGEDVLIVIQGAFNFIVGVITVAIGLILYIWQEHGNTIISVIKVIWEVIVFVVQTALAVIGTIISLVSAMITGDWTGFLTTMLETWGAIWEKIKGALAIIKDWLIATVIEMWIGILEWFNSSDEETNSIWTQLWEKVKGYLIEAAAYVLAYIIGWVAELWVYWENLKVYYLTKWNELWTGILEYIIEKAASILFKITSFVEELFQKWDNLKEYLWNKWYTLWAKIVSYIVEKINSIVRRIQAFVSKAKEIWEGFMSFVSTLWSTTWDALSLKWIDDLVEKIKTAANDMLGYLQPIKDMIDWILGNPISPPPPSPSNPIASSGAADLISGLGLSNYRMVPQTVSDQQPINYITLNVTPDQARSIVRGSPIEQALARRL